MRSSKRNKARHRLVAPLGRLWADRRGVTAILTALGATVLLGFTGLAIDAAVWQVDQRRLQGAADQAAVAAGLVGDEGGTLSAMTTAAKAVSASHGFVNGSGGVTVTVNDPPTSGSHKSINAAVEVIISQVQPQYLTKLLLASAPTATGRSVALYGSAGPSGSMCLMALDASASSSLSASGGATVSLSGCDIYNSSSSATATSVSGSTSISARNIYLSGNYTTSGGGALTASGLLDTYVNAITDPYAGNSIPSYSGCTKTSYSLSPSSSDTLSPGVYCKGMDIKGSLTLNAGTYIIDRGDFKTSSGATVTGTGVTIILTSSTGSSYGGVNIGSGSTVTLSAPTCGATSGIPGIAVWVDKHAPAASDSFSSGAALTINGAIYAPSQTVAFGGNSSSTSCIQVVADQISFSGSSTFNHSCSNQCIVDPPAMPKLAE